MLPLHQNESEPTPVLHLPLKTWADTSSINLARLSPSFHIFPVFSEPEHKQDSLVCTDLFTLAFHLSVQTSQSNLKINKASSPDSSKDNLPAPSQPTGVGAAGQTERSGEVEGSWLQSADTHSQCPQDPVGHTPGTCQAHSVTKHCMP